MLVLAGRVHHNEMWSKLQLTACVCQIYRVMIQSLEHCSKKKIDRESNLRLKLQGLKRL